MRSTSNNTSNGFIRSIAALAAASSLAFAQPQGPAKPGEDNSVSISKLQRNRKAPVTGDMLRVTLPRPSEVKLENGITLVVIEAPKLPTVTVQLIIDGAGGLFEPEDTPGFVSFT